MTNTPARDRAISDIVGYVLMVSVILVGVGFVATVGVDHVEQAQLSQNSASVQRAMELLEGNLDELQTSRAEVRTSTMSLNSGQLSVVAATQPSRIFVNVSGTGGANVSYPLGTISYRLEDAVVAYEGGGVFLDSAQGEPIPTADPTMLCDANRSIVSIVTLQGPAAGGSFGGTNADIIARVNDSELLFPVNRTGPDSIGTSTGVNVTIDSTYEGGWRSYFLGEGQQWTKIGPSTYRCAPSSGTVYVRQTVVNMSVRR